MLFVRLLVLGLGILLLFLVLRQLNPAAVLQSLSQVGWFGFAVVVIAGLVLTACLGSGLYPLLLDAASLRLVFAARQVRDSCGDILPFTQLGGIASGMRILALSGIAPARALAAGVVDVTAELMGQALFILSALHWRRLRSVPIRNWDLILVGW